MRAIKMFSKWSSLIDRPTHPSILSKGQTCIQAFNTDASVISNQILACWGSMVSRIKTLSLNKSNTIIQKYCESIVSFNRLWHKVENCLLYETEGVTKWSIKDVEHESLVGRQSWRPFFFAPPLPSSPVSYARDKSNCWKLRW